MARNREADSFVNSAVKPSSAVLLVAGMTIIDCSPIHDIRGFQELYQSNHRTAGNREVGGFVNSTVYVK